MRCLLVGVWLVFQTGGLKFIWCNTPVFTPLKQVHYIRGHELVRQVWLNIVGKFTVCGKAYLFIRWSCA